MDPAESGVRMNELSLFTGTGGGLLGSILLGWQTIGAVEIEEYPCKVLEQRQKDGILPEFPIWQMDIREFNTRIAPFYKGKVDVITAGFPCQPFSVAGQRKAEQDERNQWPNLIKCLYIIRPQFAYLENVPGLLATDYIRRIYGDLAEAGYNARWCVLGADDCGVPHRRKRWWLLADSPQQNDGSSGAKEDGGQIQQSGECNIQGDVPIALSERCPGWPGLQKTTGEARRISTKRTMPWWTTEPRLGRVAHGVANRVDRLKAIGNGQVPEVVRTAWELLS